MPLGLKSWGNKWVLRTFVRHLHLATDARWQAMNEVTKEDVLFGTAKFHELPILLIFGPGLQIMIYLVILASKARHANIMDITGAAAAPCGVDKMSMSGLGGQNNQIYHDLESRANY